MGRESSQLKNEAGQAHHDAGRVIDPPMSPTSPPYPGEQRAMAATARAPISPLGSEAAADDNDARSSASSPPKSIKKRKNKKSKRRKSLDSEAADDHLTGTTAAMADDHPAPTLDSPKKSKSKSKKSLKRKSHGMQNNDTDLLVSHAVRGSPPSGQQPAVNGIAAHPPNLDTEPAGQHLIPTSTVEELYPAPLKTEPVADIRDVSDDELPFRVADDSIVDGGHLPQKSRFIHKREMSTVDGIAELESNDEAPSPDLQPPSSESEADSGSPSVDRLQRVERSRSISRAPPLAKPTNGSVDADARTATRPPSRSSTGSNRSIPARPEDARPTSRRPSHSHALHNALQNGDAMDLDDKDFGNGNVSAPKKQVRRPNSPKKPTRPQKGHGIEAEASHADGRPDAPASSRKTTVQKEQRPQSGSAMLIAGVNKVANWLSQPARRRSHADVVDESDHEAATQSAGAVVHDAAPAEVTANNEPDVAASQPKKAKKKRQLHSKESLSLSQLEDDFGDGETQSRVSISQRSKLKDIMRGDRNSPEEETGTNLEPSQEPTIPKQTKPKRKRRSQDTSEDELDKLLAGPSGRKKPKKSSKGPAPSEHQETAVAPTKKRVSQSEVATGPWTTEELSALGQVVDQFRRGYDMSQAELNAMIHQRPEMTNPMHKDFWDSAVAAIPRRTKKQIVERTRRLYNNFVGRGRWDDEQKKELHELFEKHGNKFAEIASLVNRDQKDVRDYWRNNYVVFEHQRKWYWKPEETERLKQAVDEALAKIRIDRENNDQFRPRPRAKGFDDESLLDWQQISSAIGLTRNRQQCKWKWQELKDKGDAGAENDHLPEVSRRPRAINGVSETLANAREDYRVMSDDEKLQLIEAIHDSNAIRDSKIKWKSLVDEHFRAKWLRPTLKLVWFRLRKTVPDHEDQDVESNARYLINHYNSHQSLPRIEDHQADEQVEEKLVNTVPGSKVWRTPSQEPRAVRERQRRSSSASSRTSSRASKVSSQILRIPDGDSDQEDEPARRGRDHTPRSGSPQLGQEDVEGAGEQQHRNRVNGKAKGSRKKKREEAVPVRIPEHLNGEAADKASADLETNQQSPPVASKAKTKTKSKGKKTATSPKAPAGGRKSASFVVDSVPE